MASARRTWFSNTRLRNNVLLIVALLLVNKLGAVGNGVVYLVLLAMAVKNTPGALKALSISGFIIVASDFYVSRGAPVGPLKYVLLFVAGLTILREVRGRSFGQMHLLTLLLFGTIAALLAIVNGYYTEVALLKVASFTFGAFVLLSVTSLRRDIGNEMTEWGISLVLVMVGLSVLAYVIGAGYGSYETIWGGRFTGFRGAFTHPQTAGIMLALAAIYLTALLMLTAVPQRRLLSITLVAALGLVILSEARTGLYAYVLATGLIFLLPGQGGRLRSELRRLKRHRKQFVSLAILGVFLLIPVELLTGRISDKIVDFMAKDKEIEEITISSIYSSRSQQIERAWSNFKDHPWTGIGFGTDLDVAWQNKATLLSASTEKGFLPTAVLEEVGIIGTLFFLLFLTMLYAWLLRTRRYVALSTMTGLLLLNLGEAMFFAFGGMAMLAWTMVTLSLFKPSQATRAIPSNQHPQQLLRGYR